jgi:transposase
MSDDFDIKLKRKLESNADQGAGSVSAVRRIELITGAARRRRWSSDEKARIVVESLRPGANISEVARRNGLSPQQLFAWRREAHVLFQEGANSVPVDRPATAPVRQPRRRQEQRVKAPEISADTAMFAPVVIAASSPSSPPSSQPAGADAGRMEIAIGDTIVRIIGQVETAMLAAVLRAVRRSL